MKNAIFTLLLLFPFLGISQTLENLDYISPFHNGLAAVKKGDQWAFIDQSGDIIINFRNDLVTSKFDDENYPVFHDDRCLIKSEKNGISYFGYINSQGETTIEPQFLNAGNFSNNIAVVLKLNKDVIAKNSALGKDVVYYKYFMVTIDKNGNTLQYLNEKGTNVTLDKSFLKNPPSLKAKKLTDRIVAIKSDNNTWTIKKLD